MAELETGIKRGSDLDKLIKEKLKLMDTVDEVFLDEIKQTQNAILRRVNGLLSKFDVVDGRLVANETNNMLLAKLRKDIRKIVKNSSYQTKIDAYLRNFDTITELTEDIMLEGNGISMSKVNVNPLKREAIDNVVKGLIEPAAIDAGFEKPIRQALFNAVVLGQGVQETKKLLSNLIAGTSTKNGQLQRYVGQISRDAINRYDGQVNALVAKEYGLNAYRYVGSLVKDSRAQCVRWVGKRVLPIDTLESEIEWAHNNGSGMVDGTTPENFSIFRGGWNCRHAAIPFRQPTKE